MATITKIKGKKTRYRAQVRMRGHKPVSANFERLTDARQWAQGIESAIREGRYFSTAEAKRNTLGDLIDRYIADVLPHKPRSAASQKQQLEWWKAEAGEKTLADVTPAVISELRDKLIKEPTRRPGMKPKPRTPATVNRYLAALSHVFTLAVNDWMLVPENPVVKVRKMKEPRGRVRFLSDAERDRLIDACRPNQGLHTALLLALTTGARRMEIWGLRWSQIDFQRSRITLEDTKNGERRVLTLAGPARDALNEWAKVRQIETDLVFPAWSEKRQGWVPRDFAGPFEKALADAGIKDFRWHDLRHTTASYLAMNGATLAEIAEVLGHKTLNMVKRYAHLTEGHTAKVVNRMVDSVFSEGRK